MSFVMLLRIERVILPRRGFVVTVIGITFGSFSVLLSSPTNVIFVRSKAVPSDCLRKNDLRKVVPFLSLVL